MVIGMLRNEMETFYMPKTIEEAREIQESLRLRLKIANDFPKIELVAGVDVGYDKVNNIAHSLIVLMKSKELEVVEWIEAFEPVQFPYVPGFLSFREIPAILAAINKLSNLPDLFMVDGQGIAHPRRMGIAAHLGVLLDKPSIGVAKSCLVGKYKEPAPSKGSMTDLVHNGECIGMVVRSKSNVKPLFISPGHKIDISTAVKITMQYVSHYRLPEPTRLADKLSKVKS